MSYQEERLQAIATALKSKLGLTNTEKIVANDFATKITSLSPTATISGGDLSGGSAVTPIVSISQVNNLATSVIGITTTKPTSGYYVTATGSSATGSSTVSRSLITATPKLGSTTGTEETSDATSKKVIVNKGTRISYITIRSGKASASGTGSATISSATVGSYNSTSKTYPITGSASISGTATCSISTSGYITSGSNGSVSGTASLNASLPKATFEYAQDDSFNNDYRFISVKNAGYIGAGVIAATDISGTMDIGDVSLTLSGTGINKTTGAIPTGAYSISLTPSVIDTGYIKEDSSVHFDKDSSNNLYKYYIPAATITGSVNSVTATAGTNMTTATSGTYYITADASATGKGSTTAGYTPATSNTSVAKSATQNKKYIPTAGITTTASISTAPKVTLSGTANGFTASSTTTPYYTTYSGTATAGTATSSTTRTAGYTPAGITTGSSATITPTVSGSGGKVYIPEGSAAASGSGSATINSATVGSYNSTSKTYPITGSASISGTATCSVTSGYITSGSNGSVSGTASLNATIPAATITGSVNSVTATAATNMTTATSGTYYITADASATGKGSSTAGYTTATSNTSSLVYATQNKKYIPTAVFSIYGSSFYCSTAGYVPKGSTTSVLKTMTSAVLSNNSSSGLSVPVSTSGYITGTKYISTSTNNGTATVTNNSSKTLNITNNGTSNVTNNSGGTVKYIGNNGTWSLSTDSANNLIIKVV